MGREHHENHVVLFRPLDDGWSHMACMSIIDKQHRPISTRLDMSGEMVLQIVSEDLGIAPTCGKRIERKECLACLHLFNRHDQYLNRS